MMFLVVCSGPEYTPSLEAFNRVGNPKAITPWLLVLSEMMIMITLVSRELRITAGVFSMHAFAALSNAVSTYIRAVG
jgi:hypothetical protein